MINLAVLNHNGYWKEDDKLEFVSEISRFFTADTVLLVRSLVSAYAWNRLSL